MTKAKTPVLVSRESLQAMLDTATFEKQQAIVGRALVALFNRQTRDEQSSNNTNKDNSIGFTGADAFGGSITAKYYLKHRKLSDWQVDKWTKKSTKGFARLAKYHKQLNEVAVEKAKTKLPNPQQLRDIAKAEHADHERKMDVKSKGVPSNEQA